MTTATRRGYTVVEVMMALAVLTLGAGGVIGMQKATLAANTNARNLATANNIAQTWMERMRVDALGWNEQGPQKDLATAGGVTGTEWLGGAPTPGVGAWFVPVLVAPNNASQPSGSPAADVTGADLYAGDTMAAAFCTEVRLTRFNSQTGALPLGYYRLIRVEVRVHWARTSQPLDCSTALSNTDAEQIGLYGFVYLVSAVSENPSPI